MSAHGDVPLSQLFFALTLDAFTFMAFSADPGALNAARDGKLSDFGIALDYVQVETQKRFQKCVPSLSSSSPRLTFSN